MEVQDVGAPPVVSNGEERAPDDEDDGFAEPVTHAVKIAVKKKHLGRFRTKEEAARAHDKVAFHAQGKR